MSQVDSEQVVLLRTQLSDAKEDLQGVSKQLTNMRFRVPETFEPEIRLLRDTVLEVIQQLESARNALRRGVYEERPIRKHAILVKKK